MPAPYTFVLRTPPNTPANEREALLLALGAQAEIQVLPAKSVDWDAVLTIVKASGEAADAVAKMATLAALLYGWAQSARQRGRTPAARLERAQQQPLDLATADEQEILAWLMTTPPQH